MGVIIKNRIVGLIALICILFTFISSCSVNPSDNTSEQNTTQHTESSSDFATQPAQPTAAQATVEPLPIFVEPQESESLIVGEKCVFVINENNELLAWGSNKNGQLGVGKGTEETETWLPVLKNVASLTYHNGTCHAITLDGELLAWGGSSCIGTDHDAPCLYNPVHIADNVVEFIAGKSVCYYISAEKDLYGWGVADLVGTDISSRPMIYKTPVFVLKDVKELQIKNVNDFDYMFAIRSDNRLYSWGPPEEYTPRYSSIVGKHKDDSPCYEKGVVLEGVKTLYAEQEDLSAVFAIKEDGSLWAWGKNSGGYKSAGILCIGNDTDSSVPVHIMDNVENVIFSYANDKRAVLAIDENGSLWGWGNTGRLILPLDSSADFGLPVKLEENVRSFSIGMGQIYTNYSAIIKSDNSLWLYSNYGTKEWVKAFDDVETAILYNGRQVVAKKTDGSLWAFGLNHSNEPSKICDEVAYFSNDHYIDLDGTLWYIRNAGYDAFSVANNITFEKWANNVRIPESSKR